MNNEIKVGVIGIGYVGAPLLFSLAQHFVSYGFDKSLQRVQNLKSGIDETNELTSIELSRKDRIVFSTNIQDLTACNVYIVTVPTPVDLKNIPNLDYLSSACKDIGSVMSKGDTVIFESTVYPGCTDEICIPLLEDSSGLKFNIDFLVGYSPERINPGDRKNTISNVVKVIAGSNNKALNLLESIYSKIVLAGLHRAENIKTAEAAKIIENTQRDVNIALINEFAMLFSKMDLDTHDVLRAASTKWNFLPFKPGLVGGHCIGIDTNYMAYKAKELEFDAKMILSGRETNEAIPQFVVNKIKQDFQKKINQNITSILLLGATFKENVPDFRNSKSLELARLLISEGYDVDVHDPFIDEFENTTHEFNLVEDLFTKSYNIIILSVAHNLYMDLSVDILRSMLKKNSGIYDLKGIFPKNEVKFRL